MRVRGAVRGWKTLSRLALIGMIGGGSAACSSDASRLGTPFSNPFASNEPSATGSLGDGDLGESMTAAPAIRTPRIQSQELAAPGTAMSPRPTPNRVGAAEPFTGAVDGMNPSAGKAMTPRVSPVAPQPKLVFGKGADGTVKGAASTAKVDKAAEARREAEARKEAEAAKQAEARKAADAKKAVEARKQTETDAKKKQAAKIEPKPDAKADRKAEAQREADAKATKADAQKKVAEAKAAEAAAKAAAKETKQAAKETKETKPIAAKEIEKPAPVKVASLEPATTASVKAEASESFRWPAKGRVINGYGSAGNEGINIAVPEGTPVKAAEEGTVAYAGSDVKGYGKLVLVRHANGYVSAYAHNGELDVRPGEKVKRGQTIAKSGATGNVTSPQLHFEIRKGATPVDPIPHLAGN